MSGKGSKCTLFISGLPVDIRERELRNLFRFCSGYKGCTLHVPELRPGTSKPSYPRAFVLFETEEDASRAQQHLNGTNFDQEETEANGNKQLPLLVQFAKNELDPSKLEKSQTKRKYLDFATLDRNSREKDHYDLGDTHRSKYQDVNESAIMGGINWAGQDAYYPYSDYSQIDSRAYADPQQLLSMFLPRETPRSDPYYERRITSDPYYGDMERPAKSAYRQREESDYRPSGGYGARRVESTPRKNTTLYVYNMCRDINQDEVRALFTCLKGFKEIKIVPSSNRKTRTFGFVEFADEACAKLAIQETNGVVLPSGDKQDGGIRVAFSRSPFRDAQKS